MKTPKIRFKGFSDDWEQRKLGNMCDIVMGQSPDGSTYSDTPSKYILVQGNADLKDGWVFPRIWTTEKTKMAEVGDLIMSVRAPAGSIGKSDYDVVLGRGVAGIKGNEFIYQTLVKMDSNGYWKKLATGSTFESINSDTINNAEIIMSLDLEEQEKIGAYFSHLDTLITLHQRKCEQTKKLKKFMLQKMFPKNKEKFPVIRFKGFTDAWEQRKLGEIGSLKNGMNFSKDAMGHGYAFVNLKNIFGHNVVDTDDLDLAEASERQLIEYSLQKGDVLFVRSSVKLEGVGEAALVPENLKNTTYSGFIIRFRDENGLNDDFKKFIFSTKKVRDQIMSQATNSANKNISQSILENLSFKVPIYEEQKKIGEYFTELDTLITLHQQKCNELQNMKKFMLQNMFL